MPIYVKYDGIDGEVTAANYEKWIEIDSFSWGVSNPTSVGSTGGGGGAGKVSFQDIHIETQTNASTPKLLTQAAEGTAISFVEVDFIKGEAPSPYLKIVLNDVLVSSYQFGGAEGANNTTPSESISLNFQKVDIEYSPQNTDGTLLPPIRFVGNLNLTSAP